MENITTTSATFAADNTYKMTFPGNSDLVVPVTILSRTAKTVKINIDGNEIKTCKIKMYRNEEFIHPDGKYSMCPSVYASRPF